MLVLVGPIPIREFPFSLGTVQMNGHEISVNGEVLDINRGTVAMMASAFAVCQEYGVQPPTAMIAGDIGTRRGSVQIYEYLAENLSMDDVDVLTLHYIMPDIARNKTFLDRLDLVPKRPVLIADAGAMYVAKAGGDAARYDVFTPDLGEMAFLADEKAVHPAYTRGFIFHMENDVPQLVQRAHETQNTARTVFVKGKTDYICQDGKILEEISSPIIEEMEPVGGTGDMITGMISGLIYAGKSPIEACRIAGRVNRKAGELSHPTPATQVKDIIKHIPEALREVLKELS